MLWMAMHLDQSRWFVQMLLEILTHLGHTIKFSLSGHLKLELNTGLSWLAFRADFTNQIDSIRAHSTSDKYDRAKRGFSLLQNGKPPNI